MADEPPAVISADSLGAYEMPLRSPSSESSTGVEVQFSKDISTDEQRPTVQRIVRSTSAKLHTGLGFDKPKNVALVFVKPQACNDAVCQLVESTLLQKVPGSKILLSCTVDGATIEAKRLIDRHYKAIARYATEMDVNKLNFDTAKFEVCSSFHSVRQSVCVLRTACRAPAGGAFYFALYPNPNATLHTFPFDSVEALQGKMGYCSSRG